MFWFVNRTAVPYSSSLLVNVHRCPVPFHLHPSLRICVRIYGAVGDYFLLDRTLYATASV